MTNDNQATLRPICFMIMPYGKKPTMSDKGPATIDYNALWDKALYPFIEEDLGYQSIRADQDMSALIIKEMIERLALSDLVIADVSTPNTNVYYEIGVRHAAQRKGCVMISATWAQQTFDISQMRQARYPLPEGEITDDTAKAVRDALNERVGGLIDGSSPVFDSIPGYPDEPDSARALLLRGQLLQLCQFTTDARAARMQPKDKRENALNGLIDKYKSIIPKLPGVAIELLTSLRDCAQWQSVINYVNNLSDITKNLPVVQEIYNLAVSKTGKHFEAIAALQELMKLNGETSERWGLIGGRYKKLFKETNDPKYLAAAIKAYDLGMRKDLNDYYPSSNLPLLYKRRGRKDDAENVHATVTVATMACERSKANNPSDPWSTLTLMVMAFVSEDVDKAESLYDSILEDSANAFNFESTVPDLEEAIALTKDQDVAASLKATLDKIKALQD